MSAAGSLQFQPDAMRATAGTLDAARKAVEEVALRVSSAPVPSMPPQVAAAVRSQLGRVGQNARRASSDLAGVASELRFRAFLADLADGWSEGSKGGFTWLDLADQLLDGTAEGLSRFAKVWAQNTHVKGHWRRLANGTRTWVRGHWRNLGRDIASHADAVNKLRWAGRAVKIIGFVPDAIDLYSAFHAPADKRATEVGKAGGKVGGALAGGFAGAKVGALAGGAIGSAIPVVGTAVGALAGAVIGGAIGSFAGGELGKRIGGAVGKPIADAAGAVADVAGKAVDGAKKALSSLNPF